MKFVNPKMWSAKRMETLMIGLMQINRNREAKARSLEDAEVGDNLKHVLHSNMEDSITQARATWATTNRINSLIE